MSISSPHKNADTGSQMLAKNYHDTYRIVMSWPRYDVSHRISDEICSTTVVLWYISCTGHHHTTVKLLKLHQIAKLKCFSSRLAMVFAQSIEARWQVENEDVVRAALTGDAPTTCEWSTILPAKVQLILEVWQDMMDWNIRRSTVVPWLLMLWLLVSPDHQWPWFWPCKVSTHSTWLPGLLISHL